MKSVNKLFVVLSILVPTTAFALDIGSIKVHSELYEPLNADLQLINMAGVPAKELHISPAPSDAYYLRGVAYSPLINQLSFGVKHVNGNDVLSITTADPVVEPILNFLVQFQWPQGESIKEITILPQLPGQGDYTPLVVRSPDPIKAIDNEINRDINQKLNIFKQDMKKVWQETVDKITALKKQYNNKSV